MIEKNSNIFKDKNIKRILEIDNNTEQINVLDQRFYKRNDLYYPSVTTILNYFPKNKWFYDWLKDVGYNSDIIMQKAAYEGTMVHNAIEKLLKGEQLDWLNSQGETQYSLETWKMILKFKDFFDNHKPEIIAFEQHLYSDKHKYAGTVDLIAKIDNSIWLIDIKTSNNIIPTYFLQTAAYTKAWEEHSDLSIDKNGILWLKASTRGPQKNKIQGKGWQLKEEENIEKNFEMFKKIQEIYLFENPNEEPIINLYPLKIKL